MKLTCVVLWVFALHLCVQSLPLTPLDNARSRAPLKFGAIWSNCSKPGDGAKVDKFVISPDPLVKGGKITINFTISFFEQVTSGTITAELKYDGTPVFRGAFDLCDVVKGFAPCPTKPGTYSTSTTQVLPAMYPSGNYTAHVTATDQNKKELACIDIKLTIK